MFELQEAQQKRILALSVSALIFAGYALLSLSTRLFVDGEFIGLFSESTTIYEMSCVILIASTVMYIVIQSFRDHHQLRHKSLHDEATGLPNENFLFNTVTDMAQDEEGQGFALISVNIDRLKSVNESLGHDNGDVLIDMVGKRLGDVIYGNMKLYKLPGGQFSILFPAVTHQERICLFADEIFASFQQPFLVEDHELYVDVSIGASLAKPLTIKPSEILRRSEFALLQAKKKGGNRLVMYDEGLAANAREESTLSNELRQLIENERIELVFQPIVDAQFGTIRAAEALARWNHPDQGYISPAIFVPLADRLGLLTKLGHQVLQKACRMAVDLPEIKVAVNISPDHFLLDTFVAEVLTVLAQTGLPAKRLEIEITESVLISDSEKAIATMKKLRGLGVSIALDDFGAGYSGLSYLNQFVVDRIKIDACFVRELETSVASRSIVSTIIHLARDRGFEVTVEGIETKGQHEILQQYRGVWYQGYLFHKPMTHHEIGLLTQADEFQEKEEVEKAVRTAALTKMAG